MPHYTSFLPPLQGGAKTRQQNKWAKLTDESYKESLMGIDRKIWASCLGYGFPIKELRESFDFTDRIKKFIHGKIGLELFCGHGLIGQILIAHNRCDAIYQIDKLWSRNRNLVYNLFNKTRVYPIVEEIAEERVDFINDVDFLISMHGCGQLTDIVLDLAIKYKKDVAVCPCCYHLIKTPNAIFGRHNFDYYRIARLIERGYDVHVREMHQSISPMNRVIIGTLQK